MRSNDYDSDRFIRPVCFFSILFDPFFSFFQWLMNLLCSVYFHLFSNFVLWVAKKLEKNWEFQFFSGFLLLLMHLSCSVRFCFVLNFIHNCLWNETEMKRTGTNEPASGLQKKLRGIITESIECLASVCTYHHPLGVLASPWQSLPHWPRS